MIPHPPCASSLGRTSAPPHHLRGGLEPHQSSQAAAAHAGGGFRQLRGWTDGQTAAVLWSQPWGAPHQAAPQP